MFTHCILRIVSSALTKYIRYCKQIAYSIHYFDWLQFCEHNKSKNISHERIEQQHSDMPL